jgi:hypothetical protein
VPRLTLWNPTKGNDYNFADRISAENLHIGGVGVLVHRYIGSGTDGEVKEIQDVLFLENRDRKYDDNLIELRGHYTPEDVEYDLSQFGIFLSNDTIRFTFHYNEMVNMLGRKLISGDVIEMPNQRDTVADGTAINAYYVVQDALYAAPGYSNTWRPHLWKVRAKQMPSSSEYSGIIDKASTGDTAGGEGDGTGLMAPGYSENVTADGQPGFGCNHAIKDALDRYCAILNITDQNVAEAAENVFYDPKFFESAHLWVTMSAEGHPLLEYWASGDGLPPNGQPLAGIGIAFPPNMKDGEYYLRVDFTPDRLFQKQGNVFRKIEDDLRRWWTPTNVQLDGYINNVSMTKLDDGTVIREKSPISKAVSAKTDLYAADKVERTKAQEKHNRLAKKLDGAK